MNEIMTISEIATAVAAEKVVGRVLDRLMKSVGKVENGLKKDAFGILGQELTIFCPENTLKHSMYFEARKSLFGNRKFPGKVKNVELKSMIPPRPIYDAVKMLPDGFEIVYKYLPPNVDTYLLEVDYEIEDHNFVRSLVDTKRAREQSIEDAREYWMAAQLRCLKPLEDEKYYGINIRDLDVIVNVATHQDVKTNIPGSFQREVEVAVEWMKSRNREEKHRLSMKHIGMKSTRPSQKDIFTVLGDLQKVFLPRKFKRFIAVGQDFRYYDCVRGREFYDAPFPTWPKNMDIVSRANLSLEKPAAEGTLTYKHGNFKEEIEKIFSKWK